MKDYKLQRIIERIKSVTGFEFEEYSEHGRKEEKVQARVIFVKMCDDNGINPADYLKFDRTTLLYYRHKYDIDFCMDNDFKELVKKIGKTEVSLKSYISYSDIQQIIKENEIKIVYENDFWEIQDKKGEQLVNSDEVNFDTFPRNTVSYGNLHGNGLIVLLAFTEHKINKINYSN